MELLNRRMTDIQSRSIGLFDSGIGGLTVLREFERQIPNAHYIYLGDTARLPYGTKSSETIVRYATECYEFLTRFDIELLVVACNTVSSYALDVLRSRVRVPLIGTVDPVARQVVEQFPRGRIGILGTEATVRSGIYERTLKELDGGITVFSCACPLFVPLAEEGLTEGEIVEKVIAHYLTPLRAKRMDALILGCTHYPILGTAISSFLGKETTVFSSGDSMAKVAASQLGIEPINASISTHASSKYYVTDDPARFNRLAALFLGEAAVEAEKVALDPLHHGFYASTR